MLDFMHSIGLILLGANTYKMFAGFWPTGQSKGEVVAQKINTLPKAVFSSTLKSAPWGNYEPVEIINADAVTEVKKLKELPGKDIVLWGSISLAQSLMAADLVNVYEIRVCPTILGKGRPLFSTAHNELKLIANRQYNSGLVMLKYIPS
jgi:dihydrofolate reductase